MEFKDAIDSALNLVEHFYGEDAKDYRLEEISIPNSSPSQDWEITIGFLMPEKNPRLAGALSLALGHQEGKRYERVYKKIFLDSVSGEFQKMENRIAV